ncbi:DNA mismatch repair endonuclease MutL [Thalassotalea crassostreae]|uniref:DNA mismatch repair endonuclease MutL n=1 Tax=Thalassotalea crassostreae TaxID=1763536 RepID=UPI000837D798|nr:DNA mismatch repair endonuclease MutL [Thalassotalea crassostreae]
MTIQVLPARLANQIAAGEVVERPASVVKELVENAIDAGANNIVIDIEKGGAKRIKITDNGHGIVKDELTLALSRHATSKIKSLDDLESIHSLGFRGEALASISSVARLSLTSKPVEQDAAWQAVAIGRDMTVDVKPAAHPDGTSIDVEDLFFNTPARRKFMRTEKTEFSHIDEVVRRIALSKLDIGFQLIHNGKTIRQYRRAQTDKQIEKRIAAVCGQSFINNALPLEFNHGEFHLWGWIGQPSFVRSQNDLSYSYVNGRMMRDKLINHAIRQAYSDRIDHNGYPAFVLFFNLDYREVDVNVHPAKHEVRFHQARLVHDFICRAIEQTLENCQQNIVSEPQTPIVDEGQNQHGYNQPVTNSETYSREYVSELRPSQSPASNNYGQSNAGARNYSSNSINSYKSGASKPSNQAVENYQSLLETVEILPSENDHTPASVPSNAYVDRNKEQPYRLLSMVSDWVALIDLNLGEQSSICCLNLQQVLVEVNQQQLQKSFSCGVVSQPLLLPQSISLDSTQVDFINAHISQFNHAGISLELTSTTSCVIRQYPAQLREQNLTESFYLLLTLLMKAKEVTEQNWIEAFAVMKLPSKLELHQAAQLLINANQLNNFDFSEYLRLNCLHVDLTSCIKQLENGK